MMETIWKFEHGLVAGQAVEARWTNNNRYYRAPAEVVRVNKASVRVKLTRPVMFGATEAYPAGCELVMPRGFNFSSGTVKWSCNNGVFPAPLIEGTAVVVETPNAGTPVTVEERREAARQEAEDAEEIYPEDR